jgi:hypothetical protein
MMNSKKTEFIPALWDLAFRIYFLVCFSNIFNGKCTIRNKRINPNLKKTVFLKYSIFNQKYSIFSSIPAGKW